MTDSKIRERLVQGDFVVEAMSRRRGYALRSFQ